MNMIDIENVIVEDPESTAPCGAKGIGKPVMPPIAIGERGRESSCLHFHGLLHFGPPFSSRPFLCPPV